MFKKVFTVSVLLAAFQFSALNADAQLGLSSSVSGIEFTTAGGQTIITVSGITQPVTEGHVLQGTTVITDFTITIGLQDADRIPVSIALKPTTVTYTGLTLELRSGNTWKPVQVSIKVVRQLLQSVLLVDPASGRNQSTGTLVKLNEIRNKPLQLSRTLLIKKKLDDALKGREKIQDAIAPRINDWFPKDTGAIGGSFILIGENLDSVKNLKLGNIDLPVVRRIKNQQIEAVVVQLPDQQITGPLKLEYLLRVNGKGSKIQIPVNDDYVLVDQFSSVWPATRATIIDVSPTPDFNDMPHALKQYFYTVLYEYVPGNVVKKMEWKPNGTVPSALRDASVFTPAAKIAMSIHGEQGTGSGVRDASGGTFITGNMFVATIVGTIQSVSNFNTLRPDVEIPVMKARINIEISSFLNSASQTQQPVKSLAAATFDYNTPKKYTLQNTYAVKDLFGFAQAYSHGTTQGISRGESDIAVGMLNVNNDLAFRIASGPLGTESVWVGEPFMMSDGWRVINFNWNEKLVYPGNASKAYAKPFNTLVLAEVLFGNILKNIEGCRNYGVYKSVFNNPPYTYHTKDVYSPASSISFSFDPEHADESLTCNPVMQATPTSYPGHLDRQNIKGTFINLKADATMTNDHRVTLVLESIELYGPRGGNANMAFDNIVRYSQLLNPTRGHIIGITFPEFFKLFGVN